MSRLGKIRPNILPPRARQDKTAPGPARRPTDGRSRPPNTLPAACRRRATDYVFGGRERNPDLTPWIFCLEQYEPNGLLALGVSDATIRLLDADLKGTHSQKYPFQYPKVPFSNFLA